MSTRRLFLGLEVPDAWSRALTGYARETLGSIAGLDLYPARDLHLTLAFLGSFPEDRMAALEATLAQRVSDVPSPELVLDGTGAFPDRRRPRVLWAGVSESAPGLEHLRERVWAAATDHGWQPARADRERPFRPHVTLARVRHVQSGQELERFYLESGEEFAEEFAEGSAEGSAIREPWSVSQVALFESRPDRREARYPVLSRAPLWAKAP